MKPIAKRVPSLLLPKGRKFNVKQFAGATGGKASSTSGGIEAKDTLRSESFARVIDMLSEGEIEGFIDPDGVLCVNAVVGAQPTVDGSGRVQNNVVLSQIGLGYPTSAGSITIRITDNGGTGSGATAVPVIDDNGKLTAVTIINPGSGYTAPYVSIPQVIGKGVYLDDVPLQNKDLTFNFHDVTYDSRSGTQVQTPLLGFPAAEENIPVQQDVKHRIPQGVQVSIQNDSADSAVVAIKFNALYYVDTKTGDVNPMSVGYSIYLTYTADGVAHPKVLVVNGLVSGKTSSPYIRQHEISFAGIKDLNATDHQYLFQVIRNTVDHDITSPEVQVYSTLNYSDDMSLDSITMVSNLQMTYPNCALFGIQIQASQFDHVPSRAFHIRGVRIQVPTNYFPETRQYNRKPDGSAVVDGSGNPVEQIWDGTFYTAWSNNPAWCFYDLCTNNRYGLGQQFLGATAIDSAMLYQIAKYCDESVPDGYGGYEPRFTCNLYLQTREEAYKVLTDFASIFRAMLYWANGSIVVSQDSPQEPFMTFTNADVVDGNFVYTGTSLKTRHTVAIVGYADPTNMFKPNYEYVEDFEGIMRYGVREIQVTAFGCTSRGQARRYGKWLLFTDRLQTEGISWKTGLKGRLLRPGMVTEVYDNHRSGIYGGGRIISISSDRLSVVTDRLQTITGSSFRAVFVNPTPFTPPGTPRDSSNINDTVQSQLFRVSVSSISADAQNRMQFVLNEPLPVGIVVGSPWGLESDTVAPQLVQVIAVEPQEDSLETQITGIEYNPDKFGYVEDNLNFEEQPYTTIYTSGTVPDPPTNLTLNEENIQDPVAGSVFKVSISWSPPLNSLVSAYQVFITPSLGAPELLISTNSTSTDTEIATQGTYTFTVYSVGANGNLSSIPATATITVGFQQVDESDERVDRITGLELVGQGNGNEFIGPDAAFVWRINSKDNSYEIGSEPNGANSGGESSNFGGYLIKVYDPSLLLSPPAGSPSSLGINSVATELVIFSTTVKSPQFTFTHQINQTIADNRPAPYTGVPYRSFIFEVNYLTTAGEITARQRMYVTNPQMAVPTGVTTSKVGSVLFVSFPTQSATDFKGFRVWVSDTNGFDYTTLAPSYEGNANPVIINLDSSGTHYIRYAAFDTFSESPNDCLVSGQVTV